MKKNLGVNCVFFSQTPCFQIVAVVSHIREVLKDATQSPFGTHMMHCGSTKKKMNRNSAD